MHVQLTQAYDTGDAAVVLFCFEGEPLRGWGKKLDGRSEGQLGRAMGVAGFEGKFADAVMIPAPHRLPSRRVLILGLGKRECFDQVAMEEAASTAARILSDSKEKKAFFVLDMDKIDRARVAAHMAFGLVSGAYSFDDYKTEKPTTKLRDVTLVVEEVALAKKLFLPLQAVAEATAFAADLVNEPPNALYPESYVNRLKPLSKLGIKLTLLDESAIKKLSMGALLGVAMGSDKKPYVAILEWKGQPHKKTKPLALVGKGVTFDTGGYNLKPGDSMFDMKVDMTGSAIVVGTMIALAKRRSKAHVVGVIGLVENMISGRAQRPSDIVKTMKGTTVEIVNTDAEGRMVLADVLWYPFTKFKPEKMIDFATLTGAAKIALGDEQGAIFSNTPSLSEALVSMGQRCHELIWPMPLNDFYKDKLKSKVADLQHTGPRYGGAITAAKFLEQFVGSASWAHIDICGVRRPNRHSSAKGAVSPLFGIRLMHEYIIQNCEA